MKKLLISLFTLMSVSALAGEYNVYLKGGLNCNKGVMVKDAVLDTHKDTLIKEIKKDTNITMLFDINKVDAGINHFLEIGFNLIDDELKMYKSKVNFNANIELTKNINDNLEVGLGTGYITNPKISYSLDKDGMLKATTSHVFKEKILKIKEISGAHTLPLLGLNPHFNTIANGVSDNLTDTFIATFTEPHFNTIPIYVTAKYNLGKYKIFKPYVKADLGYAFNRGLEKPSFEYDGLKANSKISKVFEALKNATKDATATVDNGIYVGGAVGTEYKNFIGEVAFSYVTATLHYNLKSNNDTFENTKGVSNFRVGVNTGYKFNF